MFGKKQNVAQSRMTNIKGNNISSVKVIPEKVS